MKKILYSIFLLSLLSCTKLTLNALDVLSNDIIIDKDRFLKNIVYTYELIDTVDAKYGYTLQPYKYKNVLFYNYKKNDSKNVLIMFHGGAFVIHNIPSIYYSMQESILENTKKDYEIILVDLKGKKYPSQSLELESVLQYAFMKYEKVVVMGDSSGGNVVLSTLLKRRDENKKMPNGIILISPWTDLTNTVKSRKTKFYSDILFGKKYPKLMFNNPYIEDVENKYNPYVSPVYGKYHNFPKTLIQCGENELLLDDSVELYNNMKNVGVDVKLEIYEDMIHDFQLFTIFDKTSVARKNISKFLERIY